MFKGLLPAMVTPFDEHGEVDLRTTEAVVEHLVEAKRLFTPLSRSVRDSRP
jgi:dihydrodipicolinate synthase/N-acetylneuraminate lyase